MKINTWIESCRGTRLTDAEQRAGQNAASDVFHAHGRTPDYCSEQARLCADGQDHDSAAVETWYTAENAAIAAACMEWASTPEDLVLAIG